MALAEAFREERAAEHRDRVPRGDGVGFAREPVAAGRAARALDQAAASQLAQQLCGIVGREPLRLRDLVDGAREGAVPRELEQTAEAVLFLGEELHEGRTLSNPDSDVKISASSCPRA